MILSLDSIEQHLSSLSANGCSPNTIRAYRTDLKGWLQWLAEHGNVPQDWPLLEEATARYFTAHRLTWSPRTFRRRMGSTRGYARAQKQVGFLNNYRAPIAARPEPHPLAEGIVGIYRLIASSTRTFDHTLFALCGFCGLRVNEAVTITRDDVDVRRRTLRIWGKGSKERVIPISDQAFPYIFLGWNSTKPGDLLVPMTADGARKLIRAAGVRAGMPTLSSHDLRATFATDLYRRSKDLAAVQELLGHANVDTTRVYVKVAEDQLRLALNSEAA